MPILMENDRISETQGDDLITRKQSQVVYSVAENTTEVVVTSVSERRILAKIPTDIRADVCSQFLINL
jgi:hypothetical protein